MGPADYNDALSPRRAAATANALRPPVKTIPVYARTSRDLQVSTDIDMPELRNRRV